MPEPPSSPPSPSPCKATSRYSPPGLLFAAFLHLTLQELSVPATSPSFADSSDFPRLHFLCRSMDCCSCFSSWARATSHFAPYSLRVFHALLLNGRHHRPFSQFMNIRPHLAAMRSSGACLPSARFSRSWGLFERPYVGTNSTAMSRRLFDLASLRPGRQPQRPT